MARPFVAPLFLFLLVLWPRATQAANDPRLSWHTLETEHFRITYPSQTEDVARHVADLAEAIHTRLAPVLDWHPGERTEVLLADQTDSANGSATALPYNAVTLNVTAPEDMSPLGDVDDWYQALITHEYTHILHIDHTTGIPALLNKILGKTFAPNQVQPRFILEGLAVYEESARTSGGRLRSSQWDMFMRADVLERNLATLDQVAHGARRWPQGNIWYLYGSYFIDWIAKTYGEEALNQMIRDYGNKIIPYGFNRALRRATGKTFEELYEAFGTSMKERYEGQATRVKQAGLREGKRLTHKGQIAFRPRIIPKRERHNAAEALLYYADDGHRTPGLYRLPLDARGEPLSPPSLSVRTNDLSSASFTPDGSLLFSSVDITRNLFAFYDLHRLPPGKESPEGFERERERLTHGYRARELDVSPDGKKVAFVTNHRGTTYLQVGDLTPHGIEHVRALVQSARYEQVFAPRFSPDGRTVAASFWRKGGYRDIALVSLASGERTFLTRDRAMDSSPAFSPDGKWLFFHSDRSGISNIYARHLETGAMKQVTNVLYGAYQPELSSDGKTLYYVGYTSKGFDLFSITVPYESLADAPPYVDARPAPPPLPKKIEATKLPYQPLRTLWPRRYSLALGQGNFGQMATVSVQGEDIAGQHAFAGAAFVEFDKPEPQVDATYTYGRLPFDMTVRGYRRIAPRQGLRVGGAELPASEEILGADVGLAYAKRRAFDGENFSVSYTTARIASEQLLPENRLDPYETPHFPSRGQLSAVNFGFSYANTQRFLWSVGPEKGIAMGAGLSFASPWLASDYAGYAASGHVATYTLMPWLSHHSLALHLSGGTGGGNLAGRGLYYVGGFVDIPVIDAVRNVLIQGGVVLRGYPTVVQSGTHFGLFNAEYRFPILNLDRGLSTLPVFLQRITGNVFCDYGSAFDDPQLAKLKLGVGSELWFDFLLGYFLPFTFRAGFAEGLSSEGIQKVYFTAAIPF